ncbi:hypothetical protein G5V58_24380 [Nocardioides anomalus]|uniref:Uncharacterized protein n=1 Tax=Nocardioides anomalus TaxID=2712223 RepID=A0A6G6WJT9_9ACTN|nr:hypothetical protein [Nocardioides anomalus]QIG45466.1 hypothetical protein G5V58_24380 [Nocardioides anomalus]
MFNTPDTYRAEIEYRSEKIRRDIEGHRRVRSPFSRKAAPRTRQGA